MITSMLKEYAKKISTYTSINCSIFTFQLFKESFERFKYLFKFLKVKI